MDFDDLFAQQPVKNARPGRFQPKAKLKPHTKSKPPTSVSSSSPAQVTEPVKNADPSSNNDDSTSASLAHEKDFTVDIIDKTNASSSHPNLDTITETSTGQNVDTFIHLDDLLPQSTTTDMGTVPWSDAVSVDVPIPENTGGSDVPIIFDSTNTNNVIEDPITASTRDGGVSVHDKECEREEMTVMDSTHLSELTTTPVQRTEKFQPKRKVQMQKEVPVISDMDSGPNPPEINYSEMESVLEGDYDDTVDLSSIGLNDGVPTEENFEPPLNEESMRDVPEIPAKLVSRRAKAGTSEARVASNDSGQQPNACSPGQDNETTDRVLRPRKTKISVRELDEAEDHHQTSEFSDKHPASSDADEGDKCDDEHESESKVKRKRRKSTKPDEDKEKQAKKQKKAKKASDVKPKKFSHSTRGRKVSKRWLETPEDEIDYAEVPLKELIRLAEHREKQMNKEEATAQPAIKESNGNSSASHYENETYENETYESREDEEDGEDNNEQEPEGKVQDMNYFNYHTYMNKTPTIRWSKQDTELFFEAVRQFGTDLSMIQHLFPGRTRHQIKLKYKKEEKQNPFRLHDALTIRTKDVSHFQKVIERLKEIAAEEKQNADEDESMGEEAEEQETSPANDEEAKTEKVEKEEKEDVPQETGNPEEQEDDDEDDIWNNYKSNT